MKAWVFALYSGALFLLSCLYGIFIMYIQDDVVIVEGNSKIGHYIEWQDKTYILELAE